MHEGSDNISSKNRGYSEMTGWYWIWKNAEADYVGLCHYRRHFKLDRIMLAKLAMSDIDVVLTIPVYNVPSVYEVYRHDHDVADWQVMRDAIELMQPDYIPAFDEMQKGDHYYGYNMLIARREIISEYCAWLFPILIYCEENCTGKDTQYQNRAVGFLAERLTSLFFMHNSGKYKIAHCRKHFVER